MCGIFASICREKQDHPSRVHFDTLQHRGPDESTFTEINDNVHFGFHHLEIVDRQHRSNQPLEMNGLTLICNGEIYNSTELMRTHQFQVTTASDCEVILHLYVAYGFIGMIQQLQGEFAFILYDSINEQVFVVRDQFGVRPLFYGIDDKGIYFASEMKALSFIEKNVFPFTPSTYQVYRVPSLECEERASYFQLQPSNVMEPSMHDHIRILLTQTVRQYLQSERPIGCFLSGGLDSSLIASILFPLVPTLQCFTIGLEDSVDVKASKAVARHIGLPESQHHIVTMTTKEGIEAIPEVIHALESYDITTIRASIPQYLLAKYISQHTDVKVLFSGEGADELFAGYQYSKLATDKDVLLEDTLRLLRELYLFDNLRTDRTTARWGLEVRVPFLSSMFVQLVLHYDSSFRLCHDRMEKMLLRDAFREGNRLPHSILYRGKEAFSDAISSKKRMWFRELQEHIDSCITDDEFEMDKRFITTNPPKTKEALYYRKLFDEYYPNRGHILPHYWLPKWSGDAQEPSATVLMCHQGDLSF